MSTASDNIVPVFKRLRSLAYVLAGVGGLGLVAALFMDQRAFFSSFLFGFVFWMGLTLGATTITFLHHSIRATWSLSLLRIAEAANKTVPLMFALWLVIAVGMWTHVIYPWANAENVQVSELLQRKVWYLNPLGWTIRGVIYFAFWFLATRALNASSLKQDQTGDERLGQARASLGAPFGVIHVCILTFAYTDWVMSLDPAWYSTIYGVYWMISQLLNFVAFSVIIILGNRFRRPYSEIITPKLTKDVGNILLGFTMFWAYVSLDQFLIIWSGNLPEEITFYINRFQGGLVIVGGFLIVAAFFAPFTALLSGRAKREPNRLLWIAIWIFVIRFIDVFWQITPFFKVGLSAANLGGYLLDLGALAGIGGLWLILFTADMIKTANARTLIPLHDTRLIEAAAAEAAHA